MLGKPHEIGAKRLPFSWPYPDSENNFRTLSREMQPSPTLRPTVLADLTYEVGAIRRSVH